MIQPAPQERALSPDRYAMRVGGLTVAVEPASPSLRLAVSGPAQQFVTHAHAPDLTLAVRRAPLPADPEGELVFDSGASWRLYRSRGWHIYRFFAPAFGGTPYKEARLAPDLASGEVLLDPAAHPELEPLDPLEFPLDELLFLRLLAARGGLELHACGVAVSSGEGYLFAGQSGAGKTTIARLWERLPSATVLSDDRIIVRRGTHGRWHMYGTPWHGEAELAANARTPLTAILLLARGESNALESIAPARAVSSLLARSFVPFHDADLMAAALGRLESLVSEVPCFHLPFVPGAAAVRLVLESAR